MYTQAANAARAAIKDIKRAQTQQFTRANTVLLKRQTTKKNASGAKKEGDKSNEVTGAAVKIGDQALEATVKNALQQIAGAESGKSNALQNLVEETVKGKDK